jgi:hypothetical protein
VKGEDVHLEQSKRNGFGTAAAFGVGIPIDDQFTIGVELGNQTFGQMENVTAVQRIPELNGLSRIVHYSRIDLHNAFTTKASAQFMVNPLDATRVFVRGSLGVAWIGGTSPMAGLTTGLELDLDPRWTLKPQVSLEGAWVRPQAHGPIADDEHGIVVHNEIPATAANGLLGIGFGITFRP